MRFRSRSGAEMREVFAIGNLIFRLITRKPDRVDDGLRILSGSVNSALVLKDFRLC